MIAEKRKSVKKNGGFTMKKKLLQWIMTNLCAWIWIEENPQFRQLYCELFDDLSRQVQSCTPRAGLQAGAFAFFWFGMQNTSGKPAHNTL